MPPTVDGITGRVAGHSLRVGSARELAYDGASIAELQQAGGWKSPTTPSVYTREVPACAPQPGESHSMAYGSFERDRETLKYRCPERATKAYKDLAKVERAFRSMKTVDLKVRQQPLGGRVRVRASGHPRTGEDAAARHHGADDHAGNGLGAHPGRPA